MITPDMCDRKPIPGTGLVLPFRAGDASTVMRGWLSWFNRNVESLNNPGRGYTDEGSYTVVNDVGNSNHLSGTAADLNWNDHAFRVSYSGFTTSEIAACRQGLKLFSINGTQTIWWGQDWVSPKDAMHFQLNLGEGHPLIAEMAKKLREGYLGIFSGTPEPPVIVTPTQPSGDGLLQYGDHGPSVLILQKGMNAVFRSYPMMPLAVDGDFGPMTRAAVMEFQRRSPGLDVDGIVGPQTRAALAKFGIKP
jgi:hypothetical protein